MGIYLSTHLQEGASALSNVMTAVDQSILRVVDHISPGIPDDFDGEREASLQAISCSNVDTDLTDAVAAHLDELIQDVPPSTYFCGNTESEWSFVRQRMLTFLGQCFQMNYITVQLNKDTNISSLVRLHASAIRCSMEQCQRGFVFIEWYNIEPGDEWAHATAVYLDVPAKRQVFLDPSNFLQHTVIGNVLDYFRQHHIWLQKSEQPILQVNRPERTLYADVSEYSRRYVGEGSTIVAVLLHQPSVSE
jgi:hypothetical protein